MTEQLIHQAFFGWTYSHSTGGLDLIAWSSTDKDARRWSEQLKQHIRLQGDRVDKPPHALSYIDFGDGSAAVLRRVDLGHSDGRNNSHALIGPADVLTVTVALGLETWSKWQKQRQANQWMPSFASSYFADITDSSVAELMRPLATRCEQPLGTVLTRLLDKPHSPLTIIGCPVENRLPMVWALRGAADDYLRQKLGAVRRWSFSTHEVRHEDAIPRLPEIVFLPARPKGTGVANRTIVDLTPGREPASANSALATTLVTRFLHNIETPQHEVDDRVFTPQRPAPEGYGTAQPPVTLLDAKTLDEFLVALEKLETSVSGPHRRKELRDTLDVATMNLITTFAENTARKELMRRVLTVAYGPHLADLHHTEGLAHATEQIAKCESDYVARRLSANAPPNGKNQIIAAAYHRWAILDRPPVITPQPRSAHDKQATADKRAARAAVGRMLAALAIVLLIGFLLGLLVGRPTQQATGTPPAETTTSTAAPASTQAIAPGPKSATLPTVGRATLHRADRQEVYSFVKFDDNTYYPQARCEPVGTDIWQCVRFNAPPDPQPQTEPRLMAIAVPDDQVAGLQVLAASQQSAHPQGWRDEVIVLPS